MRCGLRGGQHSGFPIRVASIGASIVTQDERHLLQLVQHARSGRVSMLASSAMLLCEGQTTDRVIAAAHGFADLVGASRQDKIAV